MQIYKNLDQFSSDVQDCTQCESRSPWSIKVTRPWTQIRCHQNINSGKFWELVKPQKRQRPWTWKPDKETESWEAEPCRLKAALSAPPLGCEGLSWELTQYELFTKIKQSNCHEKHESALIPSWDGDSEMSQPHVTNTIGPDSMAGMMVLREKSSHLLEWKHRQ